MIPDVVTQVWWGHTEVVTVESIMHGRIHKTYKVQADAKYFILQQCNQAVFPDLPTVHRNAKKVFVHLSKKTNFPLSLIEWMSTDGGEDYFVHEGEWWRTSPLLLGKAFDQAANETMVFQAARGYGMFGAALAGLSVHEMAITIPRFHQLSWRWIQLKAAFLEASLSRRMHSASLLAQLETTMPEVMSWLNEPLPMRICHHDTKLNNILLRENDYTASAVIDWDTIMPGYIWSDVGDLMRSAATQYHEDSLDGEVTIDHHLAKAIIAGFSESYQDLLTASEQKILPFSGAILSYMQSIRFLADYLQDDVYYGVSFENQNLQRATVQWRLFEAFNELIISRKSSIFAP